MAAGAPALTRESFENTNRWQFSPGAEFPGASGRFEVVPEAAREGRLGARLQFDFSGGGNYVAATAQWPTPVPTNFNTLQFWVWRPAGNPVVLRCTDATGQTVQKPVTCPGGKWVCIQVPLNQWSGHWGGANDGRLHGPIGRMALLVENGEESTGAVLFDEMEFLERDNRPARVTYPGYEFKSEEGWSLRTEGSGGQTRLNGNQLTLDFSRGAQSIGLGLPDRSLLGTVEHLKLRVRGTAVGHPVRISLRTHFMTFQKVIGELAGAGEQELVTAAPPGEGWTWQGGENDGKLHGPLRLGDIQFAGSGRADQGQLELLGVEVEASCPPDKRCVIYAECRGSNTTTEFVATWRGLTEQPLAGRLHWVTRTWDGRELTRGSRPVSVPARAVAAGFSLLVQAPAGVRFLEAEFTLEIPGQDVAPAQAVWVAPPPTAGDTVLRPESPFGMGLYLYRYDASPRGLASLERAAQMARAAGVKWSREEFAWSRVEPRRGEFDWSFYDKMLEIAERNGISVYAIACYWAGWTKPYTEEGVRDYLRYLEAMVQRYRGRIKQYEIWNEPNIFFWQGPRELYAEMLKRSYAVVRRVDPQAQVLGLSTAGIDFKFIDQMMALQTPFDILTIHPYRRTLNDAEFIGDLKKVSDLVRLPDGRRRPVWLTEMGWATFAPHNTQRQDFEPNTLRAQAELIARSYLCAIVSGVEPRTFWYNFRNDGDDPIYFEHQMGIVFRDFRPKPAYATYAVLADLLRGQVLAEALPAGKGTFLQTFKPEAGGASRVIAAWNFKQDETVELPVLASATLINAVGERQSLPVVNGKARVTLRKGAPVYVLTESK